MVECKVRVNNFNRVISLIMIYLIISLTFASSLALATIYNAQAYGKDEAPGIIRSDDNLVIRTESTLPCSVSGNFTNNTYKQMNCGSGLPVSCAYTSQVTNITGIITASVMEASSGITQDVSAIVDTIPPKIFSLSTTSMGNAVKASYKLVDQANTDYPTNCSGIKKVELVLNNQVVNSTNYTAGVCTIQGSVTGNIPNYIGNVNTSIKVYDFVGLTANQTGSQVFIDATLPKISSTAKIYKAGTDEEIKIISTNGTRVRDADLVVQVDESALAESNSVFGNFSMLDKTNSADQSNMAATCTREGWNTTYDCKFTGIKLLPATANPMMTITATDEAGNTAAQNLTLSFTVVNNAGTVTRLGPEDSHCVDAVCYVKAGTNNITANIVSDSTYNDSNVFIQGTQATCTKPSDWVCQANVNIKSGATSIGLTGTDDLGNLITGQGNVTVDSSIPAKVGGVDVTPDCPTSQQTMNIMFNVSESQSPAVYMKANTALISTNNESTGSCSKIGTTNNWNCVLSISNIKDTGVNANLNIIVRDIGGNQLTVTVPVSICVEVNEVPALITQIKTRGTLPKVDRRVASKVTVKVPLGLDIVLASPTVEIMERSIPDCSATPGLADSAYLVDELSLKPTLILPLQYDSAWDDEDKIQVNCTQEFKMRNGNKIYTQREVETITAKLEVYNQALGTLDQSYTKKTDDMKKELQVLDKEIKTYNDVNKILGFICTTVEAVGKINALLQSAKTVLYGVAMVMHAIPPLIAAADALWLEVQNILGAEENAVDMFIWPQGWWPTGGNTIGLLFKGVCSIYTCKFYDFNTLVDIAVSIASHYYTLNDPKVTIDPKTGVATVYDPKTEETQILGKDGTLIMSKTKDGVISLYHNGALYSKLTPTSPSSSGTYYDGEGNIVTYDLTTGQSTLVLKPAGQTNEGTPLYYDEKGNLVTYDPATGKISSVTIGETALPANQFPQVEQGTGTQGGAAAASGSGQGAVSGPTPKTQAETASTTSSGFVGPPAPSQKTLWERQYIDTQAGITIGDRNIALSNIISGQYSQTNQIVSNLKIPPKIQLIGGKIYVNGVTGKVIASDQLTGNDILSSLGKSMTSSPFTSQGYSAFDLNVRMGNAVDSFLGDSGTWIYNPYKSKHYDGLCAPAILFNDRKERQLLCKRLGCVEAMANIGGPLDACEFDYNLGMCMYVESARYKIEGAVDIGDVFDSLAKVFLNNLVGLAVTEAYLFIPLGCAHYQIPGGATYDQVLELNGWRSAVCGGIGSLLSIREFISMFKNKYNPLESGIKLDPVETSGVDFCDGLNYTTTTTTTTISTT